VHVIDNFILLLIWQLKLELGRFLANFLPHEAIGFHVHALNPVDQSDFIDNGLCRQFSAPLRILLVEREATGESQLIDLAASAEPMLLLDTDFSALALSHELHAFPETFGP